jgi:hypothetical protein
MGKAAANPCREDVFSKEIEDNVDPFQEDHIFLKLPGKNIKV